MQASPVPFILHEAPPPARGGSMDEKRVAWLRAAENYLLNISNKKREQSAFVLVCKKTKLQPLYTKNNK